MIRVGLIGCGELGRAVHIPSLRLVRGVRLVAAADPDLAARQQAARLVPQINVLADYRELIGRADVDAVVVATPPLSHSSIGLDALAAGKHLYLEKPMATTCAEARPLLEAARASSLVAMLGFNYRFHPLIRRLRQDLADHRAGAISIVRSSFCIAPASLPPWKRQGAGGGVLLDLGSHHFDLVRFLFAADIERVFARLSSVRSEHDTAAVELQLAGGILVQSAFSFCAAEQDEWLVHGTKGTLAVDRYVSEEVEFTAMHHVRARLDRWRYGARRLLPGRSHLDKLRAPLREPSFVRAMQAFVRAIQEPGGPSDDAPGFEDGYRAMAVIEAAMASAASGTDSPVCLL